MSKFSKNNRVYPLLSRFLWNFLFIFNVNWTKLSNIAKNSNKLYSNFFIDLLVGISVFRWLVGWHFQIFHWLVGWHSRFSIDLLVGIPDFSLTCWLAFQILYWLVSWHFRFYIDLLVDIPDFTLTCWLAFHILYWLVGWYVRFCIDLLVGTNDFSLTCWLVSEKNDCFYHFWKLCSIYIENKQEISQKSWK